MRLLLVVVFSAAAALYVAGAFQSFREESWARDTGSPLPPESALHPEANLRLVRSAFERSDYSDAMLPRLERAFDEAPTFYQPPLLLAAFHANRLEKPEVTGKSFEAALRRFPSNGRLHLTYAEWLLTPRPSAPYRSYRDEPGGPDRRATALEHLQRATELEVDLTQQALGLLVRFRVPAAEWADRLPRRDETKVLILHAVDRSPRDPAARRKLLEELVSEEPSVSLHRSTHYYAERWNEPDLAGQSAAKWLAASLEKGLGAEVAQATAAVVRSHLEANETERAYRLVRDTLAAMQDRSLSSEHAADLLSLVGDAYRNRASTAMAQAFFSEAVTLSQFHVPARLGLARTYRAAGELDAARRELQKILEIDPSNPQARQEIQELERALVRAPRR